jgi:hypothetical protein
MLASRPAPSQTVVTYGLLDQHVPEVWPGVRGAGVSNAAQGMLAADWRGHQWTSRPLLAGLRRALADSGSMPWLMVMPSRSRWSPQRYCSAAR